MRKKPYTSIGITRVPCQRCGEPSCFQWQVCSLNNEWFGLCLECDIALNKAVIEFMGMDEKIGTKYEIEKRADYG